MITVRSAELVGNNTLNVVIGDDNTAELLTFGRNAGESLVSLKTRAKATLKEILELRRAIQTKTTIPTSELL